MTKRLLSMLLSVALLLSCVSGITLFTAAEETLPEPYGSVDFGGTDGAIRINGTGGMCVRVINEKETETNVTAGTAIGDTGLYGYTVDTANYGLYVGGKILNEIPDNTDVVYAVEYYIDSETPLLNTTLKVNGGAGTVSEFANLPVGKGVALYHLPAAKVDEIQANQYGGDTRVRIYIVGEGVGKLYVTGLKILDARYATTPVNPGYAYIDEGTVGACSYYPDLPAASVNQMYEQDAEITETFAGYRYYKFAAEAAAHSSSATENKPVYIKVYTNASNQNTSVSINTYQIYGEKKDGSGTAATHSALIADAKPYSINVQNGVGGVYMSATCFRNGAGIGSFRLDMANAKKVTRIEVYDVATYCNEANATVEMKAELHAQMLATLNNVVTDGYVAPTPDAPGATGVVKCATCDELLTENSEIPPMTNYAKLDFSSGELVGTAADASGFVIEQIPGTDVYGAKLNKQNQQIDFYLTDAFNIAASAVENGTDLAITYEYYVTDQWGNSDRLTLIGNGYNLGVNGGGATNVWDCLPVNVGDALKRGELNIVTYTVGAGSQYTAQFDGNIGNGTTAVAGTAYGTLSQAKALAEGKTFHLICWNMDSDGTSGKAIYLKSITVCDASELGNGVAADDHYYVDFVGQAKNPYYPDYTEKTSNGLTYSENQVEWYKEDEAKEYPRFHYMYVKVPAALLSDEDTLVATPVKLVIERKDGSIADGLTFQYQVGVGDKRWSAIKTVTFDENGRYELDLLDARFLNGLNEGASIRLRSVLYEQSGDEENGYTYTLNDTDNLEDIAAIRVYDLRPDCEAYHDKFTADNGNLKYVGRVEATKEQEGFTGNLVCAHCGVVLQEGSVIPTLKDYVKFDFSSGTTDLTGVASFTALGANVSLVPVQIPGTDSFGLKLSAHNEGAYIQLNPFGDFTADAIANGRELAITVEYYVPGNASTSTRIVFDGENGVDKILALYTNYSGTTWDAAVVNPNAALVRDQLNVATFKVGANVNYVTGPGQFSAANKFTEEQTVNTLELAQDLVSGNRVLLRAWSVTDAAPVYIKSITIFDAAALKDGTAASDHYYLDFEGEAANPYYPEYTEKSNYGLDYAEDRVEWYKEDEAQEYPRFHYMYVKVPADLLSDKDTLVATPVKLVIERKDGATADGITFQYQVGYSGAERWSVAQTVAFDENGRYELDLLDARFFNGLNGASSLRLRSVMYEQSGDAENGYTYTLNDTDNLEDIAAIRVYDLRKNCEAYHDKFTESNGNLKWVGRVEATYDEEGFTGDLVCAHCGTVVQEGTVVPTLKEYAKFDFSNGTADLTSVQSLVALDGNTSLVPVQIPGTDAYGLKLVAHNSGVKFQLAGFGGFTAEDILNGQEIAVSVEYYVPGNAVNSTRIVFDGENGANKIMALYTNYGGTTWDAAVLNAGVPMSRDQLNVATFKLGANVNYVTGPGQFSAANKFDEPQTVNTLELAQDLVSNGTIILRGWGVNTAAEDDPETEEDESKPERAVYIKSITIYDAADADIREVGGDVEYIDYVGEHTESPKYYPEYSTVGSANGLAGLQVTEQENDKGDITYVYYSVTKAKKPADKDLQPVVIRFTMKEGCERMELNFAYQTASPWTYLTLDINDGVAEAVLPDAAFTNGLNSKGSFRLSNGLANDKLVDDIAKIEVFVVQDNTALTEALSGVAELVKYKTPTSVETYMAVVDEAQAVADDPWATAEEIAAAAEKLTAAADLLVDCEHLCGTELIGYVAETCLTKGYSGDYACIDCGFIAEEDYGTEIPAHETRLINVKETSCKEAGNTGDLWCDQCQKVAKEGNVIAKLPHTFDDGVVTKAPTAQEYGELTRTCTGCGEKMTVRLEFEAQLGDVNGDGKIDSTDARLVLQFAVKKIAPTALDLSVADVNGDGKTDSTDARLILQLAVGKINEFPKE